MERSLDELPEPKLMKLKISAIKKINKKEEVRVNHLDLLLDKKFLTNYFSVKKSKHYIDERYSYQ